VGNTTEITAASVTGNLGTINIASLTCGGTYRITSASSAFSVEGFTAKPVGFWFIFDYAETSADECTLFNEDATATATNRLVCPHADDVVGTPLRAMLFYTNAGRWSVFPASSPNAIGNSTAHVEVLEGDTGAIELLSPASITLDCDNITFVGSARPIYNDGSNHNIALQDDIRPQTTVTVTGATGNLGTIDISTLNCGGAVIIGASAVAAHQIEGFTSKTDGFWFYVVSNTTQTTQYLNNDATATSTDRLRLKGNADSAASAFHSAMFVYGSSTWKGIGTA
jgi:hypothetical protein